MTIRFYDNDEDFKVSLEMNHVKIECQCTVKQFGSYENLKYSVEVHDSDSNQYEAHNSYNSEEQTMTEEIESIKSVHSIQNNKPTDISNSSLQQVSTTPPVETNSLLIKLNRLAMLLNWLYSNE